MPTHLSFAFGVGNFFSFKFDYRPRDESPARSDPKSVITDFELARVSLIQLKLEIRPLMT